ncbi:ABC transporter ATP-binding protein [Clostridium sp. Sa3CUN1]|uniref:ABC transporter ATP-binding protein n=1 Tax=Clostridium gallinarum TaxID=2762246 RepID=A0ABR8Q717_9CLOT|nr:ABC transporter ATP-binding protein [Clostridium gallinarum]MBD7916226.1 ABC transporter ATP-binding protein [Clostridium gallinarum]
MKIIELENISKLYGKDENKVQALKNISLTINKGEFVAIVGKSGSGKSTLLNILGCIDNEYEGNYFFNSINIKGLNSNKLSKIRNKNIGFVLQYFGLIKNYTVYENITLPLKYSKEKITKEKKINISNLLNELSISNKSSLYPTDLSGGQNQRVAIARAIINNPEVILADEPTGALDKKTGESIINLFKELNKNGHTIIIVTHDESIYEKCSRIIKIEDGILI